MNKLKELRKEKGLTQKKLSKEIGIPLRTIQNWENGESNIKPEKAEELADYFGVSISVLLGYRSENDSLGFKLWSLRNQKGIELEKAASDLKLSVDELKLIEQTDNAELGPSLVKDFANYYNVSVTYLLGYDDKLTVGDAIDILNAVSAGTIPPDDEIAQKIIERQKRTITNANLAMEQNYEKTKGFDLVSNVRFLSLLVEKYDKVCKDILFYVAPRIAKDELTDSELKALEEFIELFDSHFSDNQDDNNHTHDFIHEFLKQKHTPTNND